MPFFRFIDDFFEFGIFIIGMVTVVLVVLTIIGRIQTGAFSPDLLLDCGRLLIALVVWCLLGLIAALNLRTI